METVTFTIGGEAFPCHEICNFMPFDGINYFESVETYQPFSKTEDDGFVNLFPVEDVEVVEDVDAIIPFPFNFPMGETELVVIG